MFRGRERRKLAMMSETVRSETVSARTMTTNRVANGVKNAIANQLKSAAESIEDKLTASQARGQLADFGHKTAEWLGRSAEYVRKTDPEEVVAEIENKVRQSPGRSLLVAAGAGLILGIIIRRRLR